MSVYAANSGNSVEEVMAGHETFGLAGVLAGRAREFQQKVVRKPLPNFAAHCELVGAKTKKISSALAKASTWVVAPAAKDAE